MPAEKAPDHIRDRNPEDVISAEHFVGEPKPTITEVPLPSDRITGKKCLMARSLWRNDVWEEVYGLEVGRKLFIISAAYNNEPSKIDDYRGVILQILTSITPQKGP